MAETVPCPRCGGSGTTTPAGDITRAEWKRRYPHTPYDLTCSECSGHGIVPKKR